jgi:hypothetical protein
MALLDNPESGGGSTHSAIHERADQTKEVLEASGLELHGVSPLLYVWRRLGLKGLVFILLFFGLPLGEYSALRYAVYSGLPRTIGGFGLDLKVGEWSLSPLTMHATARNVRISEPAGEQPVFTAAEVEFAGSAWTLLRGLPDMLTFHLFGGDQPFHEITVRHGELHLERSLTGKLNWDEFIGAVPKKRVDEALDGVYQVNMLRVEDFRVTYVEHVPGGSGDGFIRTSQAQVKIDEVKGSITDLVRPDKIGERPTHFQLSGRSADGTFEVSGSAAFFLPDGVVGATDDSEVRRVSTAPGGAPTYPYELSIYLENIQAGAAGRMVPVMSILPVNGTIAGRTTIVNAATKPECQGVFMLTGVKFEPNPLVLTKPELVDMMRKDVERTVYTGPFKLCDAGILGDSSATATGAIRPASMLVTDLVDQATVDASPRVRALVNRDKRAFGGETVDTTADTLASALVRDVGARLGSAIGGETGRVVGQKLTSGNGNGDRDSASAPKTAGRAVVGGVKSVGSGIKRLFGGGDSKKKDAKGK